MLAVTGLTKTYRRGPRANDGVTLSAAAGQVYGVLGHNGAGKTTLVHQIVGLLKPDAGTITIDGHDVVADPSYARRACSIEPQAQVPITGMTPRQAIGLVGRLRGGRAADVQRRTADLIAALDIEEWANVDGARLSGGVKRLVSFSMAAVAPGRVVVLDEPTNDVDPVRRRLLWTQVRALADLGAAVILVTHNVVEAERSVDRLGILDHGRVIVEGSPAELKESVSSDLRLELVLEPGMEPPPMPEFVTRSVQVGHRVVVTLPLAETSEAATWAQGLQRDGRLEEFSLAPATLEDVYVEILARIGGDHAAVLAATPLDMLPEAVDVRAS
ncbi:MAG: ATP-binding cassette domain-containing protein [Chloroflexota bacterium]